MIHGMGPSVTANDTTYNPVIGARCHAALKPDEPFIYSLICYFFLLSVIHLFIY